jgi:serine/threonine protein kinase/tetratricopeptide (TPR) repeat protein
MILPLDLAMIGKTVSHYRIVEKLGGGGMGVVYKAEDTKLGRFVALKFLPDSVAEDNQAVERFMLEARAAAALSHPHICTIHEIDEFEGVPFIAMEYLEGQNLKYAIGGRPMSLEIVIEIGIQVAEALAAAHAKGITHRDIKPSNIFLSMGGQAKVVDFGLAKLAPQVTPASEEETIVADAPTQTADLTGSGKAMGTVAYMSPEQALGKEVDARSDLFSLGAVLYEMITGKQAFGGVTQAAVFDKILNRAPVPPSHLGIETPWELQQVLDKALDKNAVLRYQSALELHTDLRRLRRDMESGHSSAVVAAHESAPDAMASSGTVTAAVPAYSGSQAAISAGHPAALGTPSAGVPISGPVQTPTRRRTLWILSVLLLAAVAIIAWLLQRRPETVALTESDVLLLTDFTNTTGDPVFDDTLKQALAVKLEESPYLNILPERQVQEALGYMGREAEDRITPEVAHEICEREGLKALVRGEIAPLGSNFVVTLTADECLSGRTLAREQVEASSKEGVLAAVGTAAVEIRRELGESLVSIEKYDAPVEQATTSSLDALKNFSRGERLRESGREDEAIPLFKRAVELDPNFAMAYGALGTIYANLHEWEVARQYNTQAYELRDRVSEREELYITAHYHSAVTGDVDQEIAAYELFKQAYPRDWTPVNNLSVQYNDLGWFERAVDESRLALDLNPSHVFPYTNLGEALRSLGQLDEARRVYDEAMQKGFTYRDIFIGPYLIAFLEGDQETMKRMAESLTGKSGEAWMLAAQAKVAASAGRLNDARDLTKRAVEVARQFGFTEQSAFFTVEAAAYEAAFGNEQRSRELVNAALDIARSRDTMPYAAVILAQAGAISQAEALIADLTESFPEDTIINKVQVPMARAAIALQQQDPQQAISLLESTIPYQRNRLWAIYLRGLAYLMADEPARGMAEFLKLQDLRPVQPDLPVHTLTHLGMARANATMGNSKAARQAYEAFLERVKSGDRDIPLIAQARAELAKLP